MKINKDVTGYEGLYTIDNVGNVYSHYVDRILKPATDRNGYKFVVLSVNGIHTAKKIHRLVAIAFVDNPENKLQVNHKNGNKLDNNFENLEWCTNQENCLHAYRTGLVKITEKRRFTSRLNLLKSKNMIKHILQLAYN